MRFLYTSIICFLFIVSCNTKESPRAATKRYIPGDKQDEAAALVAKLVESMKDKGYNPNVIMDSAKDQVYDIYSVPVELKK